MLKGRDLESVASIGLFLRGWEAGLRAARGGRRGIGFGLRGEAQTTAVSLVL
jgi:hypothetical protein